MRNIVFFIFILFIFNIFNSCSDELITIVDEYNPPYQIKAIPGDNSISINFWSGVLASDFVGFNLYAGQNPSFTQPTDAILNSEGGYPTVKVSTHVRSNVTLSIPGTYNNGTLYYVTVTAYGTNELLESKYIETKISSVVPVVPRVEGDGTGNTITVNNNAGAAGIQIATINADKITCQAGWQIQGLGQQTNLNAVVVITNSAASFYSSSWEYNIRGLYVFLNGNQLAKVWITSTSGTPSYRWAYHSQGNLWAGI